MPQAVPAIFFSASGSLLSLAVSGAAANKAPALNSAGTAWEWRDLASASNLTSGTLPDARVSSNFPRRDGSGMAPAAPVYAGGVAVSNDWQLFPTSDGYYWSIGHTAKYFQADDQKVDDILLLGYNVAGTGTRRAGGEAAYWLQIENYYAIGPAGGMDAAVLEHHWCYESPDGTFRHRPFSQQIVVATGDNGLPMNYLYGGFGMDHFAIYAPHSLGSEAGGTGGGNFILCDRTTGGTFANTFYGHTHTFRSSETQAAFNRFTVQIGAASNNDVPDLIVGTSAQSSGSVAPTIQLTVPQSGSGTGGQYAPFKWVMPFGTLEVRGRWLGNSSATQVELVSTNTAGTADYIGLGGATQARVGVGTLSPLARIHTVSGASYFLMDTYDSLGNYRNAIGSNLDSGSANTCGIYFDVCNATTSGSVRTIEFTGGRRIIVADGGVIYPRASTTGLKIGLATTDKLGFWNATPVVQYSTTGTTTGFTAGSGTAVLSDSTFTGNTGSTAYTVGDIVRALKLSGIIAS